MIPINSTSTYRSDYAHPGPDKALKTLETPDKKYENYQTHLEKLLDDLPQELKKCRKQNDTERMQSTYQVDYKKDFVMIPEEEKKPCANFYNIKRPIKITAIPRNFIGSRNYPHKEFLRPKKISEYFDKISSIGEVIGKNQIHRHTPQCCPGNCHHRFIL